MNRIVKAALYAAAAWLTFRMPQFLGFSALDQSTFYVDAIWVPLLAVLLFYTDQLHLVRDWLVKFSMRHSGKVLLAVLALNLAAMPGILKIKLVRIFDVADLPAKNSMVEDYERYNSLSSEQNSFVVTLRNPNGVLNVETMKKLLAIEERIKLFEGVDREKVFSYASIRAVDRLGDEVDVSKISKNVLGQPEKLRDEKLRQLVLGNPLIVGRFVDNSAVPTVAIVQASFSPHADLSKLYNQAMELVGVYHQNDLEVSGLTQTVRDMWYRLLGLNQGQLGTAGFVFIDIACLISILFVAVVLSGLAWLLLLLFMFRTFQVVEIGKLWQPSSWKFHGDSMSGTIFTMTVLMLTPIIVVMGGLGWAGVTVDTITGIIPIVFIVVTSSYGIHLVHYIQSVKEYESEDDRILKGIRGLTKPILMASLTTAIGFITLASFEVQSISKFGIYSALGVLGIILLVLFVSAAWFRRFPLPVHNAKIHSSFETRGLARLAKGAQKHPIVAWGLICMLLIISLALLPTMHIGSRPTRFLDKGSVIPQTTDVLNKHFGANGAIFVAIDTHEVDGALQPEFLRKQQELSAAIVKHQNVAYIQDISEIIRYMYERFVGCETCIGLPSEQRTVQELLFLFEDSSQSPFLKHDRQVALMNVWGNYEKSRDVKELYLFIHQKAKELGLDVAVGSEYVLWMAQTEYLVSGKISSWLQSCVFVILLTMFAYGSLRAGLIVTTPLVMVTTLILGAMAALDIPLDISSTVITSVTVGVGADFSIHIFSNIMRRVEEEKMLLEEAIEDSLEHESAPIIYDAETNMLGFSVFLLASLLPLKHCGIMLITSMFLASFGALVIVPLLMKRFYR